MKAASYKRLGNASDVLTIGEAETPSPEPSDVLVRLHASGVNPSDVRACAALHGSVERGVKPGSVIVGLA